MSGRAFDSPEDQRARAQLIKELKAQPGLLVLVPLVRRRDVEIDSRLGSQPRGGVGRQR